MLYGLGSGIMSTVIPREAKSVHWSAGGADMQDRAAKTFTFGYGLSERGAFKPTGQFVVTANKTRVVHAAVRHLLPQSPHWRAAADETVPISAADILVTFHSLGTYVHKKLLEWRIPYPAADQEAFLHSWQVAINLLGVPHEHIPKTWAAALAQSEQVLIPVLTPSTEGIALAGELLDLTARIDLGVTRGFLNEFVRYVLGDEVGDWLGLRRDYAAAALVRTAWPTFVLFREGLSPVMPGTFYMFDQFVRALAVLFLNKGSSATTTPITIPTGNRPG